MTDDIQIGVEDEELGGQGEEGVEDPVAAKLAEIEARQAELDKQARDLNKGFMEIAAREKALQESYVSDDDEDDDLPPLAPEAEKILDRYIERKVTPVLQAQQELYAETVNSELASVAKQTGVTEDELVETINAVGLAPKDGSIRAAREVITAAAEIVKAKSFDQTAMEKRIREQILKELAENGTKIEGVKPARELPTDSPNLETMTPQEKYAYLKAKQSA